MKFVENIEKEEYENFVKTHQKGHFLQSFYWGNVSKYKHYKPHYVGLKQNDKLIATALLLEKKLIKKYGFFYCPRGFICDYNDLELLKIFTNNLKVYCKKNHGIFLRINPDIKLQELDNEGNLIPGYNNFSLVKYLTKLGYKHKGFNKDFENNEPRFTFRLNIDKNIEQIRKDFHPTTRNIINRGNIFNLNIYKGNLEDVKLFYKTMEDTAERESLILSPVEYYENFYKELNQNNMSDIYIVKVNIEELKKNYLEKIEILKQQIDQITKKESKKYINRNESKIEELNQRIQKNKHELEELNEINEKEIILSTMITAKYQNKVWTVHGGNKNELRYLNANYWLYYTIIEDAVKEGYQIIDFFGTTGNPNKNNPIYGIHLFKKRFGGEYIEFIGEFDYILNPLLYFGYTKIFPRIRKIIKK